MSEDQEQLRERLDKAEVEKREADARKTKADARQADAKAKLLEMEAAKSAAEKERHKAEKKRHKAEKKKFDLEIQKAEADGAIVKEERALVDQYNKIRTDMVEADWGVREFVRESLVNIMQGVNEAAVMGKSHDLKGASGMTEILPSLSAVGAASSAEQQTERVEFDLAVTVTRAHDEKATDSDSKTKRGFMVGVASMFSVEVGEGGEKRIEQVSGHSSSREQASRIRFAVPITYAAQNDALDDE